MLIFRLSSALLVVLLVSSCATSPTGTPQLLLFDDAQISQMGEQAFAEYKANEPVAQDATVNRYVSCVANAVTGAIPSDQQAGYRWDVAVFENADPNAFALPGGNIGVHTGILRVAENQDQLAAVLAHEVGHVLANHANARASTQALTQTGLDLVGSMTGEATGQQQLLLGALGLGAQVGVLLPYSRSQESEADELGLSYMARAGFDPRASVALWQNMKAANGGGPPEFLSTHPNPDSRINRLQALMPQAVELYQQARSRGASPDCR